MSCKENSSGSGIGSDVSSATDTSCFCRSTSSGGILSRSVAVSIVRSVFWSAARRGPFDLVWAAHSDLHNLVTCSLTNVVRTATAIENIVEKYTCIDGNAPCVKTITVEEVRLLKLLKEMRSTAVHHATLVVHEACICKISDLGMSNSNAKYTTPKKRT